MGRASRLRNPTYASYGLGKTDKGPASINTVYNFINSRDGGLGARGFWNIVNPPPPRPAEQTEYDYIIVGTGAAGSVLAARLSEDPNVSVLILESGPDNSTTSTTISSYDQSLINVPGNLAYLYPRYHQNPDTNSLETSPTLMDYSTLPQNSTRYYGYPRGCGAGGSTNHHAMIDGRGSKLIYDNIATMLDDPEWAYDNILQYYKKMETYNIPTNDPAIHGYDGWLPIRNTGLIDQDLREEVVTSLNESMGVPYSLTPGNPLDFANPIDPNEPDHVASIYIAQVQVDQSGNRADAYKNFLQPLIGTRSNLTRKFNALVGKVILEEDINTGEQVCKGVICYNKAYLQEANTTGNKIDANGNAILPDKTLPPPTTYNAKREVILCAGAICSPQILMLSGIGPSTELDALGIETKINLPGVGKNLIDHIEANISFRLDPAKIIWTWQADYLKNNTDYKKLSPPAIQASIEKYAGQPDVAGPAISLMFEWFSGVDTVPNPLAPDCHTHVLNCFWFDFNFDFDPFPKGDNYNRIQHAYDSYMPDPAKGYDPVGIKGLKSAYFNGQLDPTDPVVLLSFLTEIMVVSETGYIKLPNADPRSHPIIDEGLYKDTNVVTRLASFLFKIREAMNNSLVKDYALDQSLYEVYPGLGCDDMDKMMEYVKNWQSYGHHMAGTCKMGKADDPMSVLNSKGKVKGTRGLRVIDLSMYPSPDLHAYNPSRGIYMIAEFLSDVIKRGD